jgi:hypothetical protein
MHARASVSTTSQMPFLCISWCLKHQQSPMSSGEAWSNFCTHTSKKNYTIDISLLKTSLEQNVLPRHASHLSMSTSCAIFCDFVSWVSAILGVWQAHAWCSAHCWVVMASCWFLIYLSRPFEFHFSWYRVNRGRVYMIRILIRQQDSRMGPRSRLLANNIFLLAIKPL